MERRAAHARIAIRARTPQGVDLDVAPPGAPSPSLRIARREGPPPQTPDAIAPRERWSLRGMDTAAAHAARPRESGDPV